MIKKNNFFIKVLIIVNVYLLLSAPIMSETVRKLTIVTPYPPETSNLFKIAFEYKYPEIKIEIIKKNTNSALKYIEETKDNNIADIFWASSPDAFEVLKGKNLLLQYSKKIDGIPKKIASFIVNDSEHYYKGFAAAGYGIMENTHYMNALKLPVATQWDDLKKSIYYNHIGMSSPSRSGTTHLTVETLLQGEGWEKGWASWKEIAGNVKTITQKSYHVPKGVNKGEFGIGIVIDFMGLSYKSMGFPIDFHYPMITTLVPSSIAIIKNAANKKAAQDFINFVLSDTGQKILLNPKISRLPIKEKAYDDAPKDYPNLFKNTKIGSKVVFDVNLSKKRYNVINSLFDIMITYNLEQLKAAFLAIHEAERVKNKSLEAKVLINQARALVAKVPIDMIKASDKDFNAIFTKSRKKLSTKITGRQAKIEDLWNQEVKGNYNQAVELAKEARWL